MAQYVDLQGACAAITGAAGGIGRACAQALALNGCRIAVLDLADKLDEAHETVELIQGAGGQAHAFEIDVTRVESIKRAIQATNQGLGPLRIWVNNAGTVVRKPAFEVTEEDWDRVTGVCLRGVFFCSQAAAAAMRDSGGGSIINIASVFGLVAGVNRAPYSTSKAAAVHLTRILACEWHQYGIRVNAVAPCFVRTPMTERLLEQGLDVQNRSLDERLADPADVAEAVLFFASASASRMVTGHTLAVDGGWTAW